LPDSGNHAFVSTRNTAMNSVLIVGASLAGVRTADALRAANFDGEITIVGAEAELPYDRPPLSKQFLAGQIEEPRLLLRSADSYVHDRISLRLGLRATGVEARSDRVLVSLDDGSMVSADALVIATGTRPRVLDVPRSHPYTYDLRTRQDSVAIRERLVPGARVTIIGAGFIGAEVASTAKTLGCDVTVLEAAPAPLARALGEQMGNACAGFHTANGVSLRTGVNITAIHSDSVHLADGSIVPADVVVTGIGVAPNVEWLQGSGIAIDDGVLCDSSLRVRSADSGEVFPNIVAVGDIARFPNALFGEDMRVEHWTNAVETATHAAATLMGSTEAFAPVPYFWSDQYGKKIQFLGRASNFDEVVVVEGSVEEGSWLALYRRGDRFVGALGVSKIRSLMKLRPLLAQATSWDEVVSPSL
jgi:NADPH-dependent 2,4-dienoyl-CoA reductase/sulfur reductase-like enzyme